MTQQATEPEGDEFGYLGADAARLGVPVITVARHQVTAEISALQWTTAEPSIALLHGAGLHAHAWDSVCLAMDLPAIAIDLPGHGHSAWRSDADYTAPTIARPVAAALSTYPRITTLVGHSLGALAAIELCEMLPTTVDRLVLVDVTPGFRQREHNTQQVNAFMHGPDTYDTRDAIIQRALDHGLGRTADDLRRGVHLNTRVRADGRIEFRHHLAQLDPDAHRGHDPELLWPILSAWHGDVTLVRASHGILDDHHVDEFRSHMPGSRVVEVAGSHNIHRDSPVELADIIRRVALAR